MNTLTDVEPDLFPSDAQAPAMHAEPADAAERAGLRPHRFEPYSWGTVHGRVWRLPTRARSHCVTTTAIRSSSANSRTRASGKP